MRIRVKKIVIPAVLLLLASLYIASSHKQPINPTNRQDIIRQTKKLIDLINSRNYAKCYEQFDDSIYASISDSDIKEKFDSILNALGDFKHFRTSSVFRYKDKKTNDIACSVKCSYDGGDVIITAIFNKDKRISGIYIK